MSAEAQWKARLGDAKGNLSEAQLKLIALATETDPLKRRQLRAKINVALNAAMDVIVQVANEVEDA